MPNCEREHQEGTAYGCLFCRVGCEERVVRELRRKEPDVRLIFPVKLRYNRGKKACEKVPLFPGYVFFCTSTNKDLKQITSSRSVFRVLTYENAKSDRRFVVAQKEIAEENWKLIGSDKAIAEKLFSCNGEIGFSKAYYENDRIRIVEGFLKEYEGRITKVNHRMKTALVTIDFAGTSLKIWLGFELFEQ